MARHLPHSFQYMAREMRHQENGPGLTGEIPRNLVRPSSANLCAV